MAEIQQEKPQSSEPVITPQSDVQDSKPLSAENEQERVDSAVEKLGKLTVAEQGEVEVLADEEASDIKKEVLADGTIIVTHPDGHVYTSYPNGSLMQNYPTGVVRNQAVDGVTTLKYPSGFEYVVPGFEDDCRESTIHPTGDCFVTFHDGKEHTVTSEGLVVKEPIVELREDGTRITTFPSKKIRYEHPDGLLHDVFPDGSEMSTREDGFALKKSVTGLLEQINADGSLVNTYPDGTIWECDVDDMTSITYPGQEVHLLPGVEDGVDSTDIDDVGNVKIKFSDGTEHKYSAAKGKEVFEVVVVSPNQSSKRYKLTVNKTDDEEGFKVYTYPSGRVRKENEAGVLHDQHPDKHLYTKDIEGNTAHHYPEGAIYRVSADGKSTMTYPDGMSYDLPGWQDAADVTEIDSSGNVIIFFRDGAEHRMSPWGKTIHEPEITIHPDGHKTVRYPSGKFMTEELDGTVHEIHPDKTEFTVYPDGATREVTASGHIYEVDADKSKTHEYPNGVIYFTSSTGEGTVTYPSGYVHTIPGDKDLAETTDIDSKGNVHTIFSDGTEHRITAGVKSVHEPRISQIGDKKVITCASGRIKTHFADGTKHDLYTDGREYTVKPDGSTISGWADGRRDERNADGSKLYVYGNGARYFTSTTGRRTMTYPNGSEYQLPEYEDGADKTTIDLNGHVHILFRDGTEQNISHLGQSDRIVPVRPEAKLPLEKDQPTQAIQASNTLEESDAEITELS